MTGDDVRDARERIHLTRQACVDLLGGQLTVSALARIEAKGPKTETEEDVCRELFVRAGYTPRAERVVELEITVPAGVVVMTEDNVIVRVPKFKTLARDDILKYRGERYRFLSLVTPPAHYRDPSPYVEAANLHNGGVHCLRLEEIRDRRGRPLPEEVTT